MKVPHRRSCFGFVYLIASSRITKQEACADKLARRIFRGQSSSTCELVAARMTSGPSSCIAVVIYRPDASPVTDYMTGRGTVNIAVKQLGDALFWRLQRDSLGILCSRREDSGVAVQATVMRRHL